MLKGIPRILEPRAQTHEGLKFEASIAPCLLEDRKSTPIPVRFPWSTLFLRTVAAQSSSTSRLSYPANGARPESAPGLAPKDDGIRSWIADDEKISSHA